METSVVMHFFNEELLIGEWIKHHKQFFDNAILIDHKSTDRSRDIAESMLPNNWIVVTSRLEDFNAYANDFEVMDYEQQLPGWKMALNTTEFVFCPDLRERLKKIDETRPEVMALGSRAVCLVDKEEDLPLESPIWKNRTWGFLNGAEDEPVIRRWRYIHKNLRGNYSVGRHYVGLPSTHDVDFLHLHFSFSPWPQCKDRKLQIQTRIPESDKAARLGYEHVMDEELLKTRRLEHLALSKDLMSDPRFAQCYKQLLSKSSG